MKYMEDAHQSFPRLSSSIKKSVDHGGDGGFMSSKDGNVKFEWPSGATYEGGIVDGKRSGEGKQTWLNGSRYEGGFLNNMRHGKGKSKSASQEEYEGEYFKDHRHGKGIYRWPDGSEYHGSFYLGRKEGYGKLIFANGDVFEGLYKKDERCGPGIVTYKNSRKQDIGMWHKGKLIRISSGVDDVFTVKDHPEYQYFPDEHFQQINLRDEDLYDAAQFLENERAYYFGDKNLHSGLFLEENFLPDGIEHYCRDFEHLPLTSSLREDLNKAFFKDHYHLVKNDENAFLIAKNNTSLLMELQRQVYRHRHAAESFSANVSSIDGAPRDVFQSQQGPLEIMSENLISAATKGEGKTVYTILKSGLINPNVCDNVGNTPLLGAAINCHFQIVNLLLDMGANIDHVNDEGVSALNACHVFYYPSDHFRPNIAEKYIEEHAATKYQRSPLPSQLKKERRDSISNRRGSGSPSQLLRHERPQSGRRRKGSLSPVASSDASPSRLSDKEKNIKSAMECCKSDMKIKARYREISSARQESRQKKRNEDSDEIPPAVDETASILSDDSFQSTSVDTTLASRQNLIDFYMDVPEDLIERTATLLSMNRRAVSGISTRDGQAISLGTAGALAVWKAEHEELHQMIELLLQRGASPNKSAVPMPALFFAIKAGDTDAIRLLLLKGASTETRISTLLGGFTPLHIASAIPGKEGVLAVTLLLQAGANPNAAAQDEDIPHNDNTTSGSVSSDFSVPTKKSSSTNQWISDGLKDIQEGGRTPLQIACDRDDDYKHASDVVHELLDNGADPDVIWSGHSPLSLAISSGNDLAIDELLSFGADASLPLKRGVGNALCAAANTEYEHRRNPDGRIKLVDKLVNAGASMLAPITFGSKQVTGTVVDYAHWMFGKDSRIAHTPYHALSYKERDTYNARKRLLTHFGNLLREAAVKMEREKLKKETRFGVRSVSPSREERFLFIGAGAKSTAAPASSPILQRETPALSSHVSFPDRISPDYRPESKLSSILSQPETELKPMKVKVIKGRKGSGPIRKPMFRYCYDCGRSVGVRLTPCSRCKEVYYCSRSCKLKAWEERHRNECLRMKGNRELVSPSPAEIESYFTVHTLKEAMSGADQMMDSVKILPKSIVRNTEFLPMSKSERIASTKTKQTKGKMRKKTASSRGSFLPPTRSPHRKVQIGKGLQAKVGKEVFFGSTGMTLAELGIEENYSFE